jgi:actin-related protein
VDPAQHSLLVTEPLFNLPALMVRRCSRAAGVALCSRTLTPAVVRRSVAAQTQFDELVFEQCGFHSALIAPAPALVVHDPLLYGAAAATGAEVDPALLVPPAAALAAAQRARTMLVLDCGFSYTCALPLGSVLCGRKLHPCAHATFVAAQPRGSRVRRPGTAGRCPAY